MVERLVLYNPIGLVDPRFDRLWDATDEGYKRTLAATYQTIRGALMRYVAHNPAAWTPQFETDARIRYSWTLGADFSRKASRTGSAGNPRSRAGFQGFALHRC